MAAAYNGCPSITAMTFSIFLYHMCWAKWHDKRDKFVWSLSVMSNSHTFLKVIYVLRVPVVTLYYQSQSRKCVPCMYMRSMNRVWFRLLVFNDITVLLKYNWQEHVFTLFLVLILQNKLGDTALHSAAWKNHPHAVKMLLDKGKERHAMVECAAFWFSFTHTS